MPDMSKDRAYVLNGIALLTVSVAHLKRKVARLDPDSIDGESAYRMLSNTEDLLAEELARLKEMPA